MTCWNFNGPPHGKFGAPGGLLALLVISPEKLTPAKGNLFGNSVGEIMKTFFCGINRGNIIFIIFVARF